MSCWAWKTPALDCFLPEVIPPAKIDEHAVHRYGTNWCSDCKRAKKFLSEQRIPYHYIDVDKDEEGLRFVEVHNKGKRIIPTIVLTTATFWSSRLMPNSPGNSASRPKLPRLQSGII